MTQLWRRMLAIGVIMGITAGELAPGPVRAADPFQEIDRRFQERQQQGEDALRGLHEEYRGKRQAMETQWKQREREIEARWDQTKQTIEQKWDRALRSTPKDWVDYSQTHEARSIVDFEQGTVEVVALVPLAEVSAVQPAWFLSLTKVGLTLDGLRAVPALLAPLPDQAQMRLTALPASWTRLLHQFERVFDQEAAPGRMALAGQVVTREGKPVDRQTVKAYVQDEVLPAAVVEQKPVESRDGVARVKITAKIAMTPDHIKRRALQYQDVVPPYAKQHGLDPRLLYAVIHTESFFNPRAQSPSPTYGLMQLVPRAAARDAYNFLYKEDRVLDDEYLLDPAHNVELGAAYLRLLRKQLVGGLEAGDKQTSLLICAYKWGPANVQNKVLKQVRIQDLTDTQVLSLLAQRAPEDTRLYLRQVRDRMELYADLPPAQPQAPVQPLGRP
ncbi:MAG: DUF3393 domain-containing protein [Nitrospirae bacterium]|nr:MAG: DUF3393 domain-containing protein [Nitrospirota bacterium]